MNQLLQDAGVGSSTAGADTLVEIVKAYRISVNYLIDPNYLINLNYLIDLNYMIDPNLNYLTQALAQCSS